MSTKMPKETKGPCPLVSEFRDVLTAKGRFKSESEQILY